MEEVLEKWGLSQLIPKFKENDMTLESMYEMDDEMLKELVPSIGLRIKLKKHLSQEQPSTSSAVPITEKTPFIFLNAINTTNTVDVVDTDSTETLLGSSSSSLSSFELIPQYNKQASFIGLENFFKGVQLPEFDLQNLLDSSSGKSVLNYYKRHDILDGKQRNVLVDVIIKYLFNYILQHRLKHDDYLIIVSKIIKLFPKENPGTYYVPAITKEHSCINKPVLAKGKLIDKSKNLIRMAGPPKLRKRRQENDTDTNSTKLFKASAEAENDKVWLSHRREPWEEVLSKWTNTFEIRRNKKYLNVNAFFEDWPILTENSNICESLVNIDFDKLHPDCGSNIYSKWPALYSCVKNLKNIREDSNVYNLLLLLEEDELTIDSRVAINLILLVHMLPPKGRITIKNKHWKFSTQECIDSIVIHAKTPGDIERLIEEQKEKSLVREQPVQPYIIIEGPTIKDLNNFYVIIDEIRFKGKCLLNCLDICFKAFFIVQAQYPVQSEHIWLFIQKGIYKIHTTFDKTFPSIVDVMDAAIAGV